MRSKRLFNRRSKRLQRSRLRLLLGAAVGAALLLPLALSAHAQSPCEDAGRAAEQQYNLPVGLLSAIGRVESGRWDPALSRTVPWPWAIDVAGSSRLLANKQEAVDQTTALRGGGAHNIDVGCFQISLLHHPTAFTNLEQAFDPAANADYAARFLTELHARYGNWPDAVAAYHSATTALGVPYRQAVYARWSGAPADAAALAPRNVEPVTIYTIGGAVIRVWTPSPAGAQAALIPVNGGGAPLPRIITPGG
jgi:soluble lytic murein transglycosylase-like protein